MRGRLALVFTLVLLLMGGCANEKAGPPRPREAGTEATRRQSGIEPETETETETAPSPGTPPAPLPLARAEEDPAPAIEEELLRLINGEREANGLARLETEESMRFAAKIRAEEALASLSHTRPDETPYHTAFQEAGFPYAGKWHGENLAVLIVTEPDAPPAEVAAALFARYLESPGHHSNILSEHFTETGVGICRAEDNGGARFGAAQMFAGA